MLPRIRTIKPEFFQHEELYDLEKETNLPIRLAFAGLWVWCDREGRFRWRPRTLKAGILPHDDVDFSRVLDAMTTRGFIVKYEVLGEIFGYIPSWHKHQFINNKEKGSDIPPPPGFSSNSAINQQVDASSTREVRDEHATATRGVREGKGLGREGNGIIKATPQLRLDETEPSLCFSGSHFEVTERQDKILADAFPWVDRNGEYKKADSWIEANPEKKPKKYSRFLHNWFSKVDKPNGGNGHGPDKRARAAESNARTAKAFLEKIDRAHGPVGKDLLPRTS